MNVDSGFILLNKGKGVSSHKALLPFKMLLPKKTKLGHTGTLDPNATGLLPLAVGRASKFIQYLGEHHKKYRAAFLFGLKTDTGDIWGQVTEKQTVLESLSYDEKLEKLSRFKESIDKFKGKIKQEPPMYSAVKKNGKPLYKYARDGIQVERAFREIEIYNIDILSFDYPRVLFEVECSKGTYIRTLIEDLAQNMNELATMTSLIRLKSDGFDIKNAHSIDAFKSLEDIYENMISIEDVFADLPRVKVDFTHKKHIKNGVPVDLNRFCLQDGEKDLYYSVVDEEEKMFALAERTEESFKTLIVI